MTSLTRSPIPAAVTAATLALAGLTACSSSEPVTGAADAAACPVTVADGWVRSARSGMTAAFGTVTNTSADPVTIAAAATPAAARVELHEVVTVDGQMVMRQIEGGFAVPAGGTLQLEPGGNHLMLMGLTKAVRPGDEVTLTLTCDGGGTAAMTAQAKVYAGAQERYEQGDMASPATP